MKKTKQKAFAYYKRWRNEETYCPAFKEKVRISLKGWHHITGTTGHKKRKFSDVYRRLKLLPHAKAIIKTSATIQGIEKKRNATHYILEAVRPVKEKGRTSNRKVRVVLLEDKQTKEKIFLSVMDKKSRKKPKKKKPRRASRV